MLDRFAAAGLAAPRFVAADGGTDIDLTISRATKDVIASETRVNNVIVTRNVTPAPAVVALVERGTPAGSVTPEDVRRMAAVGARCLLRADRLKSRFNEAFVLKGPRSATLAYAIDGSGRALEAARSTMGHVLWAACGGESVLDAQYAARFGLRPGDVIVRVGRTTAPGEVAYRLAVG